MRENGQEKIYRSARIFKRGQFLNKVEQRGTRNRRYRLRWSRKYATMSTHTKTRA